METSGLEECFRKRARAVPASQGMTISTYAEKTGQTFDMAQKRLSGNAKFSITDLANFAMATGYKPSELLDDSFVLKTSYVASSALAGKEVA